MKLKIHTAFLFVLLFSVASFASNGDKNVKTISGTVVDAATGEALAGVKMKVNGTDTYCYSDLNGNYLLSVPAGVKADVLVEGQGYKQNVIRAEDLGFNITIHLNPLQ